VNNTQVWYADMRQVMKKCFYNYRRNIFECNLYVTITKLADQQHGILPAENMNSTRNDKE